MVNTVHLPCTGKLFYPFRQQALPLFNLPFHHWWQVRLLQHSWLHSGRRDPNDRTASKSWCRSDSEATQSLPDSNQFPVQVYHLDKYRARDANCSFCCLINELTDATVTIFLFASPQKLLSREWYDCIGSLIKQQSVPFSLCVDECHLYAQFGAEFHAKFHGIKALLFAPICRYPPMMPIMFLTATASTTVLDDLKDLTGLSFDRMDLLWSTATSSVVRRQVYFDIESRESPLSPLKADIRMRYGRPSVEGGSGTVLPMDKLIFYSNSRK